MMDQKKLNLIENQPDDLSNKTALTIKDEDPWDFTKSQILYGSLMSNKMVSKLVNIKRSIMEENGRKVKYMSNSEIDRRDLKI
jgi:hypothetical protein